MTLNPPDFFYLSENAEYYHGPFRKGHGDSRGDAVVPACRHDRHRGIMVFGTVDPVAEVVMATEFSFDVVSKPDLQEVKNALQQVDKVIANRYDFKDSVSEIKFDDTKFTLHSDDEFRLAALNDVFQSCLVKRGIDLRFLDYGKIEQAAKATVRQEVTLKSGLETDKAKRITKLIKDKGLKVTTQIQDQQVRVTSKSKDDLQAVMAALKESDIDVPLSYINYR
jgi:hypothetical protein